MNYSFTSPSLSPRNSTVPRSQFFDSNSESPSPKSPYMTFNTSIPYDVYHGETAPTNMFAAQNKISVEYISDDKDRRKRRSISSSKSDNREATSNMHMRRRAQNRASQRAFRERKEKHVKGLEHQLEELHEKHQDLLQSFTKQADEVSRLNSKIADLNAQLNSMRTSRESSYHEILVPDKFDKFDAFGSTDGLMDSYFDRSAVDLNSDFALHSFEESL